MMATSNLLLECLGCSTNFDSIYSLKKHTRSCKIVRTLVTKFRCLPCNAYLAEVLDLKNHVKGHDGQQVGVIGCPVCGERGFPGFNQLNHHITRAHALRVARRHVCRYCMESFESKEEMQVHVEEAHTEEKAVRGPRAGPFFCKYRGCNYISEEKNDLVKHHSLHAMNRDDVDQTLIKTRPANFYAYSEEDVNPPKRRRGRPRKNHFAFTPVQEMALAQAGVQVRRGRGRPAGTQQSRIHFLGPEDMSSENSFSDGSTEDEEGNWKPPSRLANEPIPPREPAGPPDQRLPSPPPKTLSRPRGGGPSSSSGRGRGSSCYSASTSFAAQFAQQNDLVNSNSQVIAAAKRLPAWFVGRQNATARRVVPTALSGGLGGGCDDDDEDYKPPAHYFVHETRDRHSMAATSADQPQELTVEFVNAGNDDDFIASATGGHDDVLHRFMETGVIQGEINSSQVEVDAYIQHS